MAMVVCLLALQCSRPTGGPSAPTPPSTPTPQPPSVPTPTPTPPGPQVFVGAGDIAGRTTQASAEATARLLDTIGGTVFTLGDNAYPNGSVEDYREAYEPTWGRHKARTRPSPGNHDYNTPNAGPYYDYFGANAGPPGQGYYSYELGAWHIISLNSDTRVALGGQFAWLQQDLAEHRQNKCTLAYWHHPLFSSGPGGNNLHMRETFRLLYDHHVDVVLNGHDHAYERFAEQNADGRHEPNRGIRQFVVGTGGFTPYNFVAVRPNVESQITNIAAVLKMTLNADTYGWELITPNGVRDQGLWGCH